MDISVLRHVLVAILPLMLAITLHEAAHGWVAMKLGDKTALMLGRVTLNPTPHIDPIGTIVLPVLMLLFKAPFVFGWAKPVPVTPQNFSKPRRDMALVALAGPLSNLLMALMWAMVIKLCYVLAPFPVVDYAWLQHTFVYLADMGQYGIWINGIFLFLNLLPVPPLDGSKVFSAFLPRQWVYAYEAIEPYGIWIILAMAVFGLLSAILWGPLLWFHSSVISLFSI